MDVEDEMELALRMQEICNLPQQTITDGLVWWNEEAPEHLKRFIAVMAYYEMLIGAADFADKALNEWQGE